MFLTTSIYAQGVPETDDEKAFYSIGVGIAAQLGMAKPIAENELEVLIQGVRDAIQGKTLAVEEQEGATLVRSMLEESRVASKINLSVGASRAAALPARIRTPGRASGSAGSRMIR